MEESGFRMLGNKGLKKVCGQKTDNVQEDGENFIIMGFIKFGLQQILLG
jgi:hypothetical protein